MVRIYREDWPRVILALALAVGVTAAGLLKPWPLAQLVDGWGRSPSASPETAKWVTALFGLYALHAGLGALLNLVLIHTGLRGLQRVRQSVFDWLLGLSMRRLLGSRAQRCSSCLLASWFSFLHRCTRITKNATSRERAVAIGTCVPTTTSPLQRSELAPWTYPGCRTPMVTRDV